MEWTSNIQNERVTFMSLPRFESNSFRSFGYGYNPYAGNQYHDTEIGPVSTLPESEKKMNCPSDGNELTKKLKRLTREQLDSLEQSFQEDIKLNLDRKLKLSKELCLQPRQVAVWFQNRRARWKVRHLEESYESLKQEYDVIWREKQMLHDEVKKLRDIILRDQGFMRTQSNFDNNSSTMVSSSGWPRMLQAYSYNFSDLGENQ